MRRIPVILTICALLFHFSVSQTIYPEMSSAAHLYLDSALSIIQANALNSGKTNWSVVRDSCFLLARNANKPEDTYAAIKFALRALGDGHSFFSPKNAEWQRTKPRMFPKLSLVHGRIGVIVVPEFVSNDPYVTTDYVTGINSGIDSLIRLGVDAWIIDLRTNLGGNYLPMVMGLSSLFPSDTLGYWVDAKGNKAKWEFYRFKKDNSLFYKLSHSPVAVLQGPNTASSGEVVLIAFRGRPNTRTFGTPSYGTSTANCPYILSDSAGIYLTISIDADKFGNVYGGKVIPDQYVTETDSTKDLTLETAIDWLKKH